MLLRQIEAALLGFAMQARWKAQRATTHGVSHFASSISSIATVMIDLVFAVRKRSGLDDRRSLKDDALPFHFRGLVIGGRVP